MSCSRCGHCKLDLDLELETVKRTCLLTSKCVEADCTCRNYVQKGITVKASVMCDDGIEKLKLD